LIRALRLIRWTGIPLINRITRILHAKRSSLSVAVTHGAEVTRINNFTATQTLSRGARSRHAAAAGPQPEHLAKVTGGRCVYAARRPGETIVP